jgi:hypothetical protein
VILVGSRAGFDLVRVVTTAARLGPIEGVPR